MGKGKKESSRRLRESSTSNPLGKKVKGTNFYNDAAKVARKKMLIGGRPIRNTKGEIIKAADFQNTKPTSTVSHILPNRKWFGNTRVICQKELDEFRSAVEAKTSDPHTVLLRQSKLPLSLLQPSKGVNGGAGIGFSKSAKMHLLETESFQSVFGKKAQRKRPKLSIASMEDFASKISAAENSYLEKNDSNLVSSDDSGTFEEARDSLFSKGQSKRIWSELYKVIDSSDVILHVLDARDPRKLHYCQLYF